MDVFFVSAIDFFSVTGKESFRIVVLLVKYILTCTCRAFVRMGVTGVPGNRNFLRFYIETVLRGYVYYSGHCGLEFPVKTLTFISNWLYQKVWHSCKPSFFCFIFLTDNFQGGMTKCEL